MWKRYSRLAFAIALLMSIQIALPAGIGSLKQEAAAESELHVFKLSDWGIYNDGTHPAETTKGINRALQSASQKGIKAVSLPAGTYLIAKDSRINMVSDMLFELPGDTILQKETNGKENYSLLYIGHGIHDVTIRGGVYRGDRETHDYTKKDHQHSAGTHEGGHGILLEGASNVTIEGVKVTHFTGDGLVIGGYGKMITDLYEKNFVSGAIDNSGRQVKNSNKIITKAALNFENQIFVNSRSFELSNIKGLSNQFEVYFYSADGKFISKTAAKVRDTIQPPANTAKFYLVFDKPKTMKEIYLEFWKRTVSEKVAVNNSEYAFNRRQGITVGGADQVTITGNSIHDMKGIAPQSGIDLEGGYDINGFLNSNVSIIKNEFYNNAVYDVILFDGRGALVEDNHLASKGAIGVAVSDPFSGAQIINNHFDGTRIFVENDAKVFGNKMNDSYTYFQGPNITVKDMQLIDSLFVVSSKVRNGVSVSDVTITNNGTTDSGLSVWGEPITLKNITIVGKPTLRAVTGGGKGGSTFDNLKVMGFNSNYGLTLPPGTYNNCQIEGAEGGKFGAVSANLAGKYVFNECTFKSASTVATLFSGEHPKLDLTIKNSKFEVTGNSQAISIQSASNFLLENNVITANKLTSKETEIVKLNDFWKRKEKYDILKAVIRGNTITANIKAIGVSTVNAGVGAPSYRIEKNNFNNVTYALKPNDIASGNRLK